MATFTTYGYIMAISIAALALADVKMHGMAPQGTQMLIECEFGNITSIISADYGASNCTSKDVKDKVQRLCLGLPACTIRVDDATLGGEACGSKHKDLIVEALCSDKRQTTIAAQPQNDSSPNRNAAETPPKDTPESAPQDGSKSPSKTDSKAPAEDETKSPQKKKHSKAVSDDDPTSPPRNNAKSSAEDDPKSPPRNDPKAPAEDDPKAPSRNDLKAPAENDPKSPPRNDLKATAEDDPKSPPRSDPKAENDPKSPPRNDPKAPAEDDPKSPPRNDLKAPAVDDPKSPPNTDPKSPAENDPKSPPATNAKSPSEGAPQPTPPEDAPKSPLQEAPEAKPRGSPESLSYGMLQRLVSLNGLQMSDGDIVGTFHLCDHDNDDRISGPEIDDLIAKLQKTQRSIPIKSSKSKDGKEPGLDNPATSNSTAPDGASAEKLNKLIDTLSNLSADLKELLNRNSTLPPNSTVPPNSSVPPNSAVPSKQPKGNINEADRRKQLEFRNLMEPKASPEPSPTPTPVTGLLDPWKSWGFTPAPPKDYSTVEDTLTFQIANASNRSNDTFSTRAVVYIPTGQSRKLLCSGIISDAWFSTYWWPDSPATENIRQEPECIEEESIALDTLKQMCLQKQDCTVTAPAATLSEKCPLSLKYVTVAYKCSLSVQPLPA